MGLEHYLSIFTKAVFIENMVLAYFLGLCSFLAQKKLMLLLELEWQ